MKPTNITKPRPKAYGTVLEFTPGISQAEIEKALKQIEHLLMYRPRVNEYNPDHGGPVWYIP